ncbi:nucleoside hydrolase [Amnibacterium flavum]|uniref:Nucleoside hydrolase n=1 Tax=Amnibacterium flavum TaxID=2173173 RepID=A0A2V1HLA0_9MICO|nr:nucleoside hydrolase [Amnibacterium flavum]PVZ93403.1 nucleoside hydrolase [Amnibacterium flavum]
MTPSGGAEGRAAIWADVDTGVDDALALLYLARSPRVDLVGVSAVAGNVDVDLALSNTAAVLDAIAAPAVPLHRGAAKPLLGPHRDATQFHGPGGLGAAVLPAARRPIDPRSAVEGLRDAVRARPGEITLLALGPLTNVALFLAAHPDDARGLRRIIAMTGALDGGNATASAEFNCWHDPEAVQIVIESPIPTTIFPLEMFGTATLPLAVAENWSDSAEPELALGSVWLKHCSLPGTGTVMLGDAAVACITAHPGLAKATTLPVEIDLAPGISRGRMVADRRGRIGEHEAHGGAALGTTAEIVTSVDAGALAAEYIAVLEGASARPDPARTP